MENYVATFRVKLGLRDKNRVKLGANSQGVRRITQTIGIGRRCATSASCLWSCQATALSLLWSSARMDPRQDDCWHHCPVGLGVVASLWILVSNRHMAWRRNTSPLERLYHWQYPPPELMDDWQRAISTITICEQLYFSYAPPINRMNLQTIF